MRNMLVVAVIVAGALLACDKKQPPPAAEPPATEPAQGSGGAHADHGSSAMPGEIEGSARLHAPAVVDALPPGNVVQTEMRMLTTILEATVRGIGARDVREIEHQLHGLHAAKEATTAAIKSGAYKLPQNPDKVDAFVALDEAFHEHLGALVSASRANDIPKAADALGAIMRGCEGCHATFRAPPAP